MKTDITHLMNNYRECARHLWNMYFFEQLSSEVQWDIADEFDNICVMLFSSLVLNPLGCLSFKKFPSYVHSPEALSCLQVIPSSDLGSSSIHINREKMKSFGSWDYPIDVIKPSDIEFRFIDCFDFDKLGYKSFEYYLVRIVASSTYPELIERNALIRAYCARVFFEEELDKLSATASAARTSVT